MGLVGLALAASAKTPLLLSLFLVGLTAGVLAGYVLCGSHSGHKVEVKAELLKGPKLVNVSQPPIVENMALWTLTLKVTADGSKLSHPRAVKDVKVYVEVSWPDANRTRWVRAERNVIGGLSYAYWGDALVLPHSEAELHVEIDSPVNEKPLAVIVAVVFEDGDVAYSNIVKVS
jgi:hypothetical protein